MSPEWENIDHTKCVPLCGATSAYGDRVKLHHHSTMCPVRKEVSEGSGVTDR